VASRYTIAFYSKIDLEIIMLFSQEILQNYNNARIIMLFPKKFFKIILMPKGFAQAINIY